MKQILAVLVFSSSVAAAQGLTPLPPESQTGGFAIGCQAYTFNRFSVVEAIDKTAAAGGKVIEFYPGQKLSPTEPTVVFNHDASDEVVAKVKAKLSEAGLRAVNYGVVEVPADEPGARKVFDFAKKLGLRSITTESTGSLDTIEKLVKEYGIGCGIHNHPRRPNDPSYKVWDPAYILEIVKGRDARIGAAADTGHWTRSGIKPVDALRLLEGRVVSVHLKDLNVFGQREAHDVPFGTGVGDVPAVLDELRRQAFGGNISIEYEYNWEASVPEVAQCIGFVRGYGARK
jgi:sugar phosphate isomerase/epimerase